MCTASCNRKPLLCFKSFCLLSNCTKKQQGNAHLLIVLLVCAHASQLLFFHDLHQALLQAFAHQHLQQWLHLRGAINCCQPTTAQRSTARHNTAEHGTTRHSTTQHGTARHVMARCDMAQHMTVRQSTAQISAAQHSTARHSMSHCTTAYSTAPYGRAWYLVS